MRLRSPFAFALFDGEDLDMEPTGRGSDPRSRASDPGNRPSDPPEAVQAIRDEYTQVTETRRAFNLKNPREKADIQTDLATDAKLHTYGSEVQSQKSDRVARFDSSRFQFLASQLTRQHLVELRLKSQTPQHK